MSMVIKVLWALLGLGVVIGAVALATWGIPAPTGDVRVVIPTEKFFSK